MPDFNYLFVCGCARSGTSALTHLVNAHDDVVVGVERFGKLWDKGAVKQKHFEEKRFFNLRETDARNLESKAAFLARVKDKYASARIRGDKYPVIYKKYERLKKNFDSYKVLFIVRNPFSVALSHQKRFENPEDPFSHDGMKAVFRWNVAIQNTLRAIEDGTRVTVVSYDRAFASVGNALKIFDGLGLDRSKTDLKRAEGVVGHGPYQKERTVQYREALLDHVSRNSDMDGYRHLINTHCILRDADPAPVNWQQNMEAVA